MTKLEANKLRAGARCPGCGTVKMVGSLFCRPCTRVAPRQMLSAALFAREDAFPAAYEAAIRSVIRK